MLTEELKDAYSADKQALRCMQRAVRKASAQALREGIQMHIEQTQGADRAHRASHGEA